VSQIYSKTSKNFYGACPHHYESKNVSLFSNGCLKKKRSTGGTVLLGKFSVLKIPKFQKCKNSSKFAQIWHGAPPSSAFVGQRGFNQHLQPIFLFLALYGSPQPSF